MSKLFPPEMATDENLLAISWNIATEPKLYLQLAPNPYTPDALKIISERFPEVSTVAIIRAVVLAEPERKYERLFKQLPKELQEAEKDEQSNKTTEITRRLDEYFSQHAYEFGELAEDLLYDLLFKCAFETFDLQEVEQRYSQKQRKDIKLLILNLVTLFKNVADYTNASQTDDEKPAPKTGFVVPKRGKTFSKIAFGALVSISFFYLAFLFLDMQIVQGQTQNTAFSPKAKEQILATDAQKTGRRFPVRLKIPSINVDASVEAMGLTTEGAMDVPGNTIDVGWYKLGPSPGEKGSAVISGHFDGGNGGPAVFNKLDKLKPGDKISVINDLGTTTTFVVKGSRTYSPGYADEVFLPNERAHLNLVTCDGVWDGTKKSYNKRLVVFADTL